MTKARDAKGKDIATDLIENEIITMWFFKHLMPRNNKNLGEMDKFLGRCKLLKLSKEEIESPNCPMIDKDI